MKINIRKTKVMIINDKKMTKVRTRVEKIEQTDRHLGSVLTEDWTTDTGIKRLRQGQPL